MTAVTAAWICLLSPIAAIALITVGGVVLGSHSHEEASVESGDARA